MKTQFTKNLTLKQRLLWLQGFFLLGMLCLLLVCGWLKQRMEKEVIFPNFEAQIINRHKDTLKTMVDTEAQLLGRRIQAAKSRTEQMAIIEAETDQARFFPDRSGYFFTYDTNGVRINVPINKSQNGQNLIDLKDSTGYAFVRAIVDAAVAGGDFVQYRFEKPGQGVQPKLSYTAMVPGTEFFVGAGVYIDDVQREREALAGKLNAETRQYIVYVVGLCCAVVIVMAFAGAMLSRSIAAAVRRVADGLSLSADHVAGASNQLSITSQSLAAGSSEQAASIEETGASLEMASSTTQRNAESVGTAKDLARQTRTAADQAVRDMQTMSQAMDALKNSSNDIAKIIQTIDEIAFQTNILALNAAVEAARAGEAGMGFAVVADEVRNLAQRSAQAAKETAAKIEGAIRSTGQGVAVSGTVAQALSEILAKASRMDELAAEIAAASNEQAGGITQINQAVSQVDKITQANAASAEETAASAEELNAQAETMKRLVLDLVELVGGGRQAAAAHPTAGGKNSPAPKSTGRQSNFTIPFARKAGPEKSASAHSRF